MNKIKYIALILVLMLGLIGGAYAYWQETLTVDGTVSTAEFDVKFQNLGALEYYHGSAVITGDDLGGANVDSDISDDGLTIDLTVNNAWPNLWVMHEFDFNNNSSIPVKLEGIRVWFNGAELTYEDGDWHHIEDDAVLVIVSFKLNGNYAPVGSEGYEVGTVVDEKTVVEGNRVWVGIADDGEVVPQNETFDFEIQMDWVQWNKP